MANDVERMYYGGNQAPSSGVTRDDLHKFIMKIVQAQGPAGTFEYDPLLGNTAYFSLLSLMYKGHPLGRYSPIDPDGQVRTAIEIPYEPGVVTIPTSESDIQTKVQSALDDDKFPVLTDNSDYYVYSGKTQGGDDVFFKIEGTVITTAVVDSTDTVTQTSVDLAGFIETVECASGPNIGAVGTPSVSAVNDPVLHKTTLTFDYLKGEKGDQGNPGTNGTNGTNGTSAYWFKGTAVTGTGTGISAVVSGSKAGDMYLNSNTQDVYIATAANMWDYVCNIKGATGSWGGTVDQNYNAASTNPQSGTAVAQAVSVKLNNDGDASDTTSTFTKASGDISSMTSGGKLSAIFTAISSFFASLKALAFKDSVGTSDIANDAITAAKVKDNETLPVNISGNAASATDLAPGGTSGQYLKSNGSGNAPSWDNTSNLSVGVAYNLPYAYIECNGSQNGTNDSALLATIAPPAASSYWENKCFFDILLTADGAKPTVKFSVSLCVRADPGGSYLHSYRIWKKNSNIPLDIDVKYDSSSKHLYLIVRRKVTTAIYCGCTAILRTATGWNGVTLYAPTWLTLHKNSAWSDLSGLSNASKIPNTVGSDTRPVYMDADGSVQPCGFQINFGSTLVAGSNVLNIAN